MDIVPLKCLTNSSGSVPIQVRVCRLWRCTHPRNKTLISVDMIVADTEGTAMWVIIKSSLADKFSHLVTIDNVYSFKNFRVSTVKGEYRPVTMRTRLYFSILTNVERIGVPVPAIPMHVFEFVPHATVVQRAGDLTDVVGLLLSIGEVEAVSGGSIKRELSVLCPTEGKVKITLWQDQAQLFVSAHRLDAATETVMLVATSMKIVYYSGTYSFSATTGTQLYIDLDHADVARARAELAGEGAPVVFIGRSPGTVSTTAEAMSENRMTVSEILAAEWAAKKPGYRMTFVGCITEILTQHGWYYLGCVHCKVKSSLEDGYYRCGVCKDEMDSPMVYYKLNFTVQDLSGTLICTTLNKVAERMVDSCAKKLFNRVDPESDSFPRPILDGQEFIFKIQLSTHNLEQGSDSFTVVDVFTVDRPAVKTRPSAAVGKATPSSPSGSRKRKSKMADSQTEVNLTLRKRKGLTVVSSEDDEE